MLARTENVNYAPINVGTHFPHFPWHRVFKVPHIPMPAPPLAPMSDDMQGECSRTPSSSRWATQCPLFPPVQHYFTAAGGDLSTLKAPMKAFSDFTNVEGWADTQA